MAIKHWSGGAADGVFLTAGNWVGGVALPAGDTGIVDQTGQTIAGADISGTITSGIIQVGTNFYGTIGTPANPLLFGGTMDLVQCSSEKAQSLCFSFATCTQFTVDNSNTGIYAVFIKDGALTRVAVNRGKLRLGADTNPVTINVASQTNPLNDAYLHIESGSAAATVNQSAGYVKNEAAQTTINGMGGIFEHAGITTGNIATLNIHKGFDFKITGYNANAGFTYGAVNVFPGGVLRINANLATHTWTAINAHPGSTIVLPPTHVVTTLNRAGDVRYIGPKPGTDNYQYSSVIGPA